MCCASITSSHINLWAEVAMKVYVLTSGDYSGYRISGVFLNKGLATKAAKTFSERYRRYDVEEFETDEMDRMMTRGFQVYNFQMDRYGATDKIVAPELMADISEVDEECFFYKSYGENKIELWFCIIAKNSEHAIKIANEKRSQIIAMNLWPDELPEGKTKIKDAVSWSWRKNAT